MFASTKKLFCCIALITVTVVNALERTADAELSSTESPEQQRSIQDGIGAQGVPNDVLVRFNSLDKPPKVLKLVTAAHPGEGYNGTVLVTVRTNEQGDVVSVEPLFGKPELYRAVAKSLLSSKFAPTGKPQTFGIRSEFKP